MEPVGAQQAAQIVMAQPWISQGGIIALILAGLWTVTTGLAITLVRMVRDGFAKNDAGHLRLFQVIDDHKRAADQARRDFDRTCEERMGGHGTRLGKLEVGVGKLQVKNGMRGEPLSSKGGRTDSPEDKE